MSHQCLAISNVALGHIGGNAEQRVVFEDRKPVQKLVHGIAGPWIHGQELFHGTSVVSVGTVGACQRTSGGSFYKRLTRANGWGSAGQCPALSSAKTPAAWERVSHLVANTSSRSPVQEAVGGGVEA